MRPRAERDPVSREAGPLPKPRRHEAFCLTELSVLTLVLAATGLSGLFWAAVLSVL